ncbi:MAG: hypothetical protein EON59_06225 [Alphaproteobacteria bacterium]|nr:MAG: hypothetical protein EON59_06225 [Alphaproteobacteria bacterium]
MKERLIGAAWIGYQLIGLATFVFLMFFDGYSYTWWNWIIAIPANLFLSAIWPIYFLILRPLFGS